MQYHIMFKNLSKSYGSKGTAKTALSDVTLNIPQGEIFCIMGSSGSGKSTLLKILGGMEKPTSGTFYINGANMADYGQQDYDRHRQMTVGYCENNYPEQSSGGEQQRAAICRAIIKSPELILADDPTGSLAVFYHSEYFKPCPGYGFSCSSITGIYSGGAVYAAVYLQLAEKLDVSRQPISKWESEVSHS